MLAQVQDVTDRRRAERQVDRFFELLLDFLLVAGLDGHIHRASPSWEATFGWRPDESEGRLFADFFHDAEELARGAAEVGRLARGEDVAGFEMRWSARDGGFRWLRWSATARDGLIYAAAHDITQRRETGSELGGARPGAGGFPAQVGIPGHHEPRDPHADERHHRACAICSCRHT